MGVFTNHSSVLMSTYLLCRQNAQALLAKAAVRSAIVIQVERQNSKCLVIVKAAIRAEMSGCQLLATT